MSLFDFASVSNAVSASVEESPLLQRAVEALERIADALEDGPTDDELVAEAAGLNGGPVGPAFQKTEEEIAQEWNAARCQCGHARRPHHDPAATHNEDQRAIHTGCGVRHCSCTQFVIAFSDPEQLSGWVKMSGRVSRWYDAGNATDLLRDDATKEQYRDEAWASLTDILPKGDRHE